MSDTKTNTAAAPEKGKHAAESPSTTSSPPATSDPDQIPRRPTVSDTLRRTFSTKNARATGNVLKSMGNVAVGMHPLWLMGEAITGKKIGSHASKGRKEFIAASQAFREVLSTSKNDIIVIIDEQLRDKQKETSETADVIKSAGENIIVVVSSSIEKARIQMEKNSPALKKSIIKNGRQVVVVADQSLKHPMVITGVTKFAKSRGIPFPEAILRVASLALSKVLAALPEDIQEEIRETVEEIDAEELERSSSTEAEAEAKSVGKQVEEGEKDTTRNKDAKGKKDDGCVIA